MVKLPQKPANLRPYKINLIVNKQRFIKVEINPLIATVKHPNEGITDELIIYLLTQLNDETVEPDEKKYHQWTYYAHSPLYNEKGRAYWLVWCVAHDEEPQVIGLMDCYRIGKFDKK